MMIADFMLQKHLVTKANQYTSKQQYYFLQMVIGVESRHLHRQRRIRQSAALRNNHILLLSLGLADFLMGVYLIMLGVHGVIYDGKFCNNRFAWLSSTTCSSMGVLVVLSSEASVMTLVLLTSLRLYSVAKVSFRN